MCLEYMYTKELLMGNKFVIQILKLSYFVNDISNSND